MDKDKILSTVTEVDVTKMQAAWAAGPLSHIQLILLDEKFRAVSEDSWNDILPACSDKMLTYQKDWADCDDFSIVFCGHVIEQTNINSTAIVFDSGGKHSFNAAFFIKDKVLTVKVIEPQQSQWADISQPMYVNSSGFAIVG